MTFFEITHQWLLFLYWISDYNFSIKCGGPQITSSSGIVYESDIPTENESQELGPASYYVINTGRWAVSNVGYFNGTDNPHYTSSSSSQFSNTLDSELFQTARVSASSLRYYGLGLENGNYTVSLQFAETAFNNSKSWKGLGRRVFDIYIQVCIILSNCFWITVFYFKWSLHRLKFIFTLVYNHMRKKSVCSKYSHCIIHQYRKFLEYEAYIQLKGNAYYKLPITHNFVYTSHFPTIEII